MSKAQEAALRRYYEYDIATGCRFDRTIKGLRKQEAFDEKHAVEGPGR
jgi:hypothetical protein